MGGILLFLKLKANGDSSRRKFKIFKTQLVTNGSSGCLQTQVETIGDGSLGNLWSQTNTGNPMSHLEMADA